MSSVSILHLSDTHFKIQEEEGRRSFHANVIEKMITAIGEHVQEHGIPDFVAITGDISFDGKNYTNAKKFFYKLRKILPDTTFLPIPGNHDVDRDEIFKLFSLHNIVSNQETDIFLETNKYIKTFVIPKFRKFIAFANELNPGLYSNRNDYFWVKNYEKKGISFVGLNSAWACESIRDRSNISLGSPQIKETLDRSKSIPNRILLMHHPLLTGWLNERDHYSSSTDMLLEHFSLILHGHCHSDKALVSKSPGYSCIGLGANASYTTDKDGYIGFQFIYSDFAESSVTAKVYPYIFDIRRSEFVPDQGRYKKQGGKEFYVIQSTDEILGEIRKPVIDIEGKLIEVDITSINPESLVSLIKPFKEIIHNVILKYNNCTVKKINILNKQIIDELTKVESLDLSKKGISDLSVLKDFFGMLQNLKVLHLNNNGIEDISVLKRLKNLETLSLYCNKIRDISSLKELKNLRILDLYWNDVADISALIGLKELKELILIKNPVAKYLVSRDQIKTFLKEHPDCNTHYIPQDIPNVQDHPTIKSKKEKEAGDSENPWLY